MTKKDVIELLETIAVYMEVSLENVFKVSAYRKAAAALESDSRSLDEIKTFTDIDGIGKGVNEVIVSYVESGESEVLNNLKETVPPGLVRMLKIPTLGPKKIAKIHKELGITSIEDLKRACENNEVSTLNGFGKKTEENILSAIKDLMTRPERYPIENVLAFRTVVEEYLDSDDKVEKYSVTGSARRLKETSRDIDYIAIVKNVETFTDELLQQPFVKAVIARGDKKLSITIVLDFEEINVDFRFVQPEEYATTLHHFTGSKEHNVKMRQIAKITGEKISEYGVEQGGTVLTFDNEDDFYRHFNLNYIPPTMRETGEETDVAVNDIVHLNDIKGDIHMHTVYSDGAFSVRDMVEACIDKGYEYVVITDHSKSLRVANGLDEVRLMKQVEEVRQLDQEYAEIDIYAGTEMDILKDGTLDFSDETLSHLDYVIASIHSSFSQDENEIMYRLKAACENQYVRHIAHPTGRLIGKREGYNVNMETLLQMAKDTNTILEVNANPRRLDLNAETLRNCEATLTVNTDAHHVSHLDFMKYGIATLQKGLIKKNQVINTMAREEFKEFVNYKK